MTDKSQNQTQQEEVDELVDEMATEFFEDPRIMMDREDGEGEILLMRIIAKQLVEMRRRIDD